MTALPTWINSWFDKAYERKTIDAEDIYEALAIAWEALDYYQHGKRGSHSTMPAENAMLRIENLGEE